MRSPHTHLVISSAFFKTDTSFADQKRNKEVTHPECHIKREGDLRYTKDSSNKLLKKKKKAEKNPNKQKTLKETAKTKILIRLGWQDYRILLYLQNLINIVAITFL